LSTPFTIFVVALVERRRVENRLREVREGAGLSISGLARATGVSRQTIYDLEAGRSRGTLETWIRLATALDTNVEELSGQTSEVLEEYEGKVLAR
jgi:DNA-binding XRE family transcriptional regulator